MINLNHNEGIEKIDNKNVLIKNSQNFINLSKLIDKTWKQFLIGEFKVGMDSLSDIFMIIEYSLKDISFLNESGNTNIDLSEIFNKLSLLENAMRIPDYILIADLIKYEVKPIILNWKNSVEDSLNKFNN